MVSFLHAADLHLGIRMTRFEADLVAKIREARVNALDNIMKRAAERQVDFVLIAGDLFDDHAVDQTTASRAFKILDNASMPVYVLSGNHDPFLPGAVWDRPPWNEPNPRRVRVLRRSEPVEIASGVLLLPCPVLRQWSLNDPTAWIGQVPCDPATVRIGVAHGSLRIHDNLPANDHLIAPNAAQELKLDYLALGHWHRRQLFTGPDGVERTAYCGVHEPMRFAGSSDARTGWVAYSGEREEFNDAGKGEVLHVRLRGPGARPEIEPVQVNDLVWQEERYEVASAEDFARLTRDVATRESPRQRLLRLKVSGVLEVNALEDLEALRQLLKDRYFFGELDDSELHVRPTEEEIREVAGQGILRRVLDKLQVEAADPEPANRRLAERSVLLLYQIARGLKG